MKFINNLVAFKDIVTFLESICVLFAEKRGYCPSQNELNKTLNNYKKKCFPYLSNHCWIVHLVDTFTGVFTC